MNCQKDDLAYIVGLPFPYSENNGHVVHVISRFRDGRLGPRWKLECQTPLRGPTKYTKIGIIHDCFLRPIRGKSGDDESFKWAPKREGEHHEERV